MMKAQQILNKRQVLRNVQCTEKRQLFEGSFLCFLSPKLIFLRRLLRVPWTARRSNQSILKEISSKYSLERLMLKLKLQYFGTWCKKLTHLKRPWCSERLKVGGEGDNRGWDDWMEAPTRWTWVYQAPGFGEEQWALACCSPQGCKESDMTERLNWTEHTT